jgi:hypothetical protein
VRGAGETRRPPAGGRIPQGRVARSVTSMMVDRLVSSKPRGCALISSSMPRLFVVSAVTYVGYQDSPRPSGKFCLTSEGSACSSWSLNHKPLAC